MKNILNYTNYIKINEKLANVDSDVDMLYELFFKTDVDEMERSGLIKGEMFKRNIIDTSVLETEECKRAHELNPCVIKINTGKNIYAPSLFNDDGVRNDKSTIEISFSANAINYVNGNYGSLKDAIDSLDSERQKVSLSNEFKEERIKGSIHHELAHWLDDTLNNNHLSNIMSNGKFSKIKPINASTIEIQGQIHNIKQLYNKNKDIWDNITFDEMINMSPSLSGIRNALDYENKLKWTRKLKSRMYREVVNNKPVVRLLGKMMIDR